MNPPASTNSASPPASALPWRSEDAASLYRIADWGKGMFKVNSDGHVHASIGQGQGQTIDLKNLTEELAQRDLHAPLLVRFTDLLHRRMAEMAEAFASAIEDHDYQGRYQAVYPIKVNQQRHVVEAMMDAGKPFGFGLEAGSKPELLAVMAMVEDPTTPIICNGFKDQAYIEAVVLAGKLGKNTIPVIEKFSELPLIIEQARRHNVRPKLGVRVKLATRGAGRWENSTGERSKFGLFVSELLDLIEYLRSADMLDCLSLLHCHIGSQVNDIRKIKSAVTELSRIYAELIKLGAGIKTVDVGGGLGVDYDGSNTAHDASTNYTLQEYANDVVYHLHQVCEETGTPHPDIISESGRAMAAHHSVLVFNVLGWSGFDRFDLPEAFSDKELDQLPQPVRMLAESHLAIDAENYNEHYHDALLARDQALSLFSLGYCTLEQRGLAERLFFNICSRVLRFVRTLDKMPEEFAHLEATLSEIYFCNCSIFQSLPDHWAIDQTFPIMPIHRLNERPTCHGILADITCDSDGKIDRFIGDSENTGESARVLPLHPYTGEDYYLAAFLVGAYQETLGDLHNLFGDTNAVHVRLGDDGQPIIEEVVEGDTAREVLSYVQYDPDDLKRRFGKSIEQALRENRLNHEEARTLRRFYDSGLAGSTYLT